MIEPPRSCVHQHRHLEFPGGYASLTANGNWTAYFSDRPGEVFTITACPGCLVPLWGLPASALEPFHSPAQAHGSRWRPAG